MAEKRALRSTESDETEAAGVVVPGDSLGAAHARRCQRFLLGLWLAVMVGLLSAPAVGRTVDTDRYWREVGQMLRGEGH